MHQRILRKAVPKEQKVGVGMDGYSLNLQSYCSYCKDFSPVLEQIDISCFGERDKYINSISCENKSKCERMCKELIEKHDSERNK